MFVSLRHDRVRGDGVDLHVASAGAGPPVILLHGFPDGWSSWRLQIDALAAAGFRALAPDLRGYGRSDRPRRRDAYHLRHLVADVAALVRSTGGPRAHLVGHDWGGVIAWTFAARHPELLDRLAILNAPHPRLYSRAVWRPPQLLRSWYAWLFQLPRLPELVLSVRDFAAIRWMLRELPYRKGAFSEADIRRRVEALSPPGALAAAVDYYRANLRPSAIAMARSAGTGAETLVIWGEHDPALGVGLLRGLDRVAPRVRVHRIPDAGHWVHREAPGEVNRVLVEFLRDGTSQPPPPGAGRRRRGGTGQTES